MNKILLCFILSILVHYAYGQGKVDTLMQSEHLTIFDEVNESHNWTGWYVILSDHKTKSGKHFSYSEGVLLYGKRNGIWKYYNYNEEHGHYVITYETELIEDTPLKEIRFHRDSNVPMVETQYSKGNPKDIRGYYKNGAKKYEIHKYNHKKPHVTDEVQIHFYPSGRIKSICTFNRYISKSNVAEMRDIGIHQYYNHKGELYLIEEYDNKGKLVREVNSSSYDNNLGLHNDF